MISSTGELLALRGSQTPRLWSAPAAATTTGPEAVELAAQAGLYLDPWQQFVLRHGLGEKPEWCCRECIYRTPADRKTPCPEHPDVELVHPWSAPTVTLICPRQNGKNAILEARELARKIADKIEKELQYPGEIKVSVIRETRVIEYAR